MRRFAICSLVLLASAPLYASPTIITFKLNSTDGKPWSLDDCKDKKAVVVIFIGTQCPINNAFMPRLIELQKTYGDKGVQLLAINPNEHDSDEAIAEHAKKFGLTFPVLRDAKQWGRKS